MNIVHNILRSSGAGIAGMRDRLIHDYVGVDYELVWDVVQTRIPELRKQLASLL